MANDPGREAGVVREVEREKEPPVRGADIPGRYFLDFYNGGKRGTKNINLRTTYDPHQNDETERLARQVALNYEDMDWRAKHRFELAPFRLAQGTILGAIRKYL